MELVVVIAILGILAAIAVPKFTVSQKNAAVSAHNANVRTLEGAANMYIAEGNLEFNWPGTENEEYKKWGDYLQSWPTIPKEVENSLEEGEGEEKSYKVEVKAGTITVTPGLRKLEGNSIVKVATP